jgi:serine/threonine protein kinase
MEFCDGGDVSKLIKSYKKKGENIPEDTIWRIFTQVILALNECHRRKSGKVLHRDLKPGNIFLDA